MAAAFSILAQDDGMFVFPWYSWVGIGAIVILLIGYKIYQNKMMG